jgi:hypothetical protein
MKIRMKRHYKIFCVNGKYGIHYGFCIFFILDFHQFDLTD